MTSVLDPILLAQAVAPRPFDINPVLSPWLLFMSAVIAAVAVVYLYSSQKQIASRKIVIALTSIRIALILLVIVLLLGPIRQWVYTAHSNGTLYVLLDRSLSMKQKDAQATDQERLAWADALGYLPRDLLPDSSTIDCQRLSALQQDLGPLRSDADRNDPSVATHLSAWRSDLLAVGADLDQNAQVKQSAQDLPATIASAADALDRALIVIQSQQRSAFAQILKLIIALLVLVGLVLLLFTRDRLRSRLLVRAIPAFCVLLLFTAIGLIGWAALQWPVTAETETSLQQNAEIPWQLLHDELATAITQLSAIADDASRKFLAQNGSDPRLQSALARVSEMDRAALALAAVTGKSNHQLKGLPEIMNRQDIKVIPFGDRTQIATPEKNNLQEMMRKVLTTPGAPSTDISAALKLVCEQSAADSTVLIVSDGQQNAGSEPEIPARFLSSRGTRVFSLCLGSHELVRDAAVDHVDAPDWVYAEDQVVVSPVIRLDALREQDVIIDLARDNQVVDTRTIRARTDQEKQRLRLTDRPPREGLYNYTVRIHPVPAEAIADNNSQLVQVAVKKDRLNVLIVEDEPGWEYQFLRNYLVRDHRVKLQVVLLSPGHIEHVESPDGVLADPSRDEGKIDAQILPQTPEQWSAFDIVIMGDVPPEKLTEDQQINLTRSIRDGSVKALVLLAGQRNMPMRYAGTPLAEILPVDLSASPWAPDQLQDQLLHGFSPSLAPDGTDSILGQLSQDAETNAQIWANLPLWYWHSEQTAARPAATVIWSIQDVASTDANVAPAADALDAYQLTRRHALLSSMNAGLGRVLYLASPQTWRFRYVQTPGDDSHIEDAHRRFWGQVVRWAVGNDLPAGGRFVRFGAEKRNYIGGEPIVLTARVLGENFSPLAGDSFKIVAEREDHSPAGETSMTEAPSEGAGIYRGSMTLPAGLFYLRVSGGQAERLLNADNTVEAAQKTLRIEVSPNATLEDRDVNADPQHMESIAKAGSGIAMDGSYFDVLANRLPVIDHTQVQIVQAGLFTNPDDPRTRTAHWICFAVFVILITAEWILRKRGGLV